MSRRTRSRDPLPRRFWVVSIICSAALALVVGVAITSPSDPDSSDDIVKLTPRSGAEPGGLTAIDGPAAEVGQPAPNASFENLATGETMAIGDFAGSPLVLNFWGSTCAPCVAEMPVFESLHQRIGDKVKFLGIDVADSVEAGRAMVERTGITYPSGRDPRAQVFTAFGGRVQPYTVFIRPDGIVAGTKSGAVKDAGELTDLITEFLG